MIFGLDKVLVRGSAIQRCVREHVVVRFRNYLDYSNHSRLEQVDLVEPNR